jgi:hypothetical protein
LSIYIDILWHHENGVEAVLPPSHNDLRPKKTVCCRRLVNRDQSQWEEMWQWRKAMNAAVSGAKRAKSDTNKK